DYLAPGVNWKGDYSMLLAQPAKPGPPEEMFLDGWIDLQNETGVDLCARNADLVAGDVQLLNPGGAAAQRDFQANAQMLNRAPDRAAPETPVGGGAEIAGMSVFSRVRLGRSISLTTGAPFSRFPLFHRLQLPL